MNSIKLNWQRLSLAALVMFAAATVVADPLSSNNGLYPDGKDYSGSFNAANLDYPTTLTPDRFPAGGPTGQALSVDTAQDYMLMMKEYLQPSLSVLINDYQSWDPVLFGWYDLVWSGDSSDSTDPTAGREAIMNTYTGQILHASSFSEPYQPTSEYVQNHAVIYYDARSAYMLGKVWNDLYDANIAALSFPEGAVVAKVEATTPSIEEWPQVLTGAASWSVFRPTTQDQATGVTPLVPQVVTAHPLQMSIKVKDSVAAPETGWVWMAFVYDANAEGDTAWDRFVPLGAMWGNDPQFNRDPNGLPAGESLAETWINPNKPGFTENTLGWGGRLAGPMDVATRQGVITVSGKTLWHDRCASVILPKLPRRW